MRYIVLIPLAVFHSGAFNVRPFLPGCSLAWHPWQGCCSVYNTYLCLCSVCKFSKRNPKKSEAFCSLLLQIGATAGSRQPFSRWLVGHPRVPPPSPPLIPLRLVRWTSGNILKLFFSYWSLFTICNTSEYFFLAVSAWDRRSAFQRFIYYLLFSLTEKQL